MTLNLSSRIPFMRQYQISVDAARCPPHRHYGCRHPPPSAHPNRFVRWDIERVSEGLIPARWLGLFKIGSVGLDVTPALRTVGDAAGPDALLPFQSALLVSCSVNTLAGTKTGSKIRNGEFNSLDGGFAYATYDCFISSSRSVKEWK